ncbi:MAG TPA: hypothetical protein VLA59_00195 [Patescibacteria group bacterium]|nr:hypothetical protein [Patescibacteria group bacterium]
MRRWLAAASSALAHVSDRPTLWVPGALAWVASVGWIPFVAAVVRVPTQSELTYFGAGMQTSGLWPLNLVLIAAGAVAVVTLGVGMVAVGNAALDASLRGRPFAAADAGRRFVTSLIGVLPVALVVFVLLVATIAVAPAEFNRPQAEPGPVLRTLGRLLPLLVLGAVVAVSTAALAGLAGRAASEARSVAGGLAGLPAFLRRAGPAGLLHIAVTAMIGVAFLVLSGLLVHVLWAPIGAGLIAGGAIDATGALLLVGFVAIWLCLVLAGGALHAWGSATWSALLHPRAIAAPPGRPQEASIDR